MALNYLTSPVGRGILVTRTKLQNNYNNFVTWLDTSKLDDQNIAPNAGFPESWISWSQTGGHDHRDGSLSIAAIRDPQISSFGSESCQWVLTPSPGTLMIFGVSKPFNAGLPEQLLGSGVVLEVEFGEGSDNPNVFEDGTLPVVHLTLFDRNEGLSELLDVYGPIAGDIDTQLLVQLESVTSKGFTFRYFAPNLVQGTTVDPAKLSMSNRKWRVQYMAVGVAPGMLTMPSV